MTTFGCLFIVTSLALLVFKGEKSPYPYANHDMDVSLSIKEVYRGIYRMSLIAPFRKLTLLLLTYQIGFSAGSAFYLEYLQNGLTKEKQTLTDITLIPIQVFWPFIFTKFAHHWGTFTMFWAMCLVRVAITALTVLFISLIPIAFSELEWQFLVVYYVFETARLIVSSSLQVTVYSIFAEISDVKIGSTYLAVCYTLANFGGQYPETAFLYILGLLSPKNCILGNRSSNSSLVSSSIWNSSVSVGSCYWTHEETVCFED